MPPPETTAGTYLDGPTPASDYVGMAGSWVGDAHAVPGLEFRNWLSTSDAGATIEHHAVTQVLAADCRFVTKRTTGDGSSAVAWAGAVWRWTEGGSDGDGAIRAAFHDCVSGDTSELPRRLRDFESVRGSYAAAVADESGVVLFRPLESLTHLYYRVRRNEIRWSTDFMDLVDDPVGELDRDLVALMAWGEDALPYRDIEMLRAGEYARFDANGVVRDRFDDFPAYARPQRLSLVEWGEYARKLVYAAVAERVRPYGRVGLMLSGGGMDSSALARCLVDLGVDLRIYHWASASFPAADESEYARLVARHLGVQDRLTVIDAGDPRKGGAEIVNPEWRFRVPYVHGLYWWWREAVEAAANDGVECLVSGSYGDSVFSHHGEMGLHLASDMRSIPFREAIPFFFHSLTISMPIRRLLRSLNPLSDRHIAAQPSSTTADGIPSTRQVAHYSDRAVDSVLRLKDVERRSPVLQQLALNVNDFIPHGITHVAPYFDRRLYGELRWSIPDAYRLLPYAGQLIRKPVQRQAFVGLLPPQVLQRHNQGDLSGAYQWYFLEHFDEIQQLIGEGSYLAEFGIVDPDRLRALPSDRKRFQSCAVTLMRNCMVELWLRNVAPALRPA